MGLFIFTCEIQLNLILSLIMVLLLLNKDTSLSFHNEQNSKFISHKWKSLLYSGYPPPSTNHIGTFISMLEACCFCNDRHITALFTTTPRSAPFTTLTSARHRGSDVNTRLHTVSYRKMDENLSHDDIHITGALGELCLLL